MMLLLPRLRPWLPQPWPTLATPATPTLLPTTHMPMALLLATLTPTLPTAMSLPLLPPTWLPRGLLMLRLMLMLTMDIMDMLDMDMPTMVMDMDMLLIHTDMGTQLTDHTATASGVRNYTDKRNHS